MFWCHHCCLVAFSWLQKNFTLLLSQKTPPLLAIALIITCKYAQNIPKTGSFCFFFSLGSMSTELPCNGRSSERKPNKSKLLRTCSLETQFYSWIISFVNSSCRHCPKVLAFVFQRQTWGKKKKKIILCFGFTFASCSPSTRACSGRRKQFWQMRLMPSCKADTAMSAITEQITAERNVAFLGRSENRPTMPRTKAFVQKSTARTSTHNRPMRYAVETVRTNCSTFQSEYSRGNNSGKHKCTKVLSWLCVI